MYLQKDQLFSHQTVASTESAELDFIKTETDRRGSPVAILENNSNTHTTVLYIVRRNIQQLRDCT